MKFPLDTPSHHEILFSASHDSFQISDLQNHNIELGIALTHLTYGNLLWQK